MTALGVLISFAQGITVGAAAMLVFSVLGIVSQSASVTGTRSKVRLYGWMTCIGATTFSAFHLLPVSGLFGSQMGKVLLLPAGLLCGMFVGVLLSALTEILDIFPALSGKLKLSGQIKTMVFSLALGKTIGVLIYYLTPWFIGL